MSGLNNVFGLIIIAQTHLVGQVESLVRTTQFQ